LFSAASLAASRTRVDALRRVDRASASALAAAAAASAELSCDWRRRLHRVAVVQDHVYKSAPFAPGLTHLQSSLWHCSLNQMT
jgi:hypothetical protein